MKPRASKLMIEVFPASDDGRDDDVRLKMADDAVLAIARLIGRQMAREHFQRQVALEQRNVAQANEGSSGKA